MSARLFPVGAEYRQENYFPSPKDPHNSSKQQRVVKHFFFPFSGRVAYNSQTWQPNMSAKKAIVAVNTAFISFIIIIIITFLRIIITIIITIIIYYILYIC